MKLWIISLLAAVSLTAQQAVDPDEKIRGMWNEEFLAKRPQGAGPRAKPARKPPAPVKKDAGPAAKKASGPGGAPASEQAADALVGVTLWTGDGENWARLSADTPLRAGQKLRVSIESARTGYLYVIDREQYADESYGEPYLVFPTLRTHGGDNSVVAGRLIEIPAWEDHPRYLTMNKSRADQTSEVLTVLVTSEPLSEVKLGRDQLKLAPEQVATWEKQWGAQVKRIEAKGDVGKRYTPAEREAGERKRLLTHDEPLPQTMYHCEAQPGQPLLINVPMRLEK